MARRVDDGDYGARHIRGNGTSLVRLLPNRFWTSAFLGDQPALQRTVVEQVVAAYQDGRGSILIPSYQMRRGHPILIAREHWGAIFDLQPPQSLRDFLRHVNASAIHHIDVTTPSILGDMDTPSDYQRELHNHLHRAI